MRIIATIPHPSIRISVFHMNDKYIVKLEAGPMEQAFKFSAEEVKGPEHIEKILDAAFMQKALERFNEMFISLQAAQSRNS
jgi:hypothetical protein